MLSLKNGDLHGVTWTFTWRFIKNILKFSIMFVKVLNINFTFLKIASGFDVFPTCALV